MSNVRLALLTGTLLTAGFVVSQPVHAQESAHARAKAEVETRDAQKHNKLKTEGVPAAGGAVAGGVVGGPAGAFAGAKLGHTVGSVFHGVKKHQAVKKQEKLDAARRYHTTHTPAHTHTTTRSSHTGA